jgi:hypothetical protein
MTWERPKSKILAVNNDMVFGHYRRESEDGIFVNADP